MPRVLVLDSWPVLEWVKGKQPYAEAFRSLVEEAILGDILLHMSRINHGEVVYTIHKDLPNRVVEATAAYKQIPILVHTVDDLLVDEAAAIKGGNKVSYADAFAAALALRLGFPLLTGDRELRQLTGLGLEIVWVGA